MPCTHIKLPGGGGAIVCSSTARRVRRCAWCSRLHTLLCDWKVGEGKTCDKPMCAEHGQEVAADKHLCPDHQTAYQLYLDARARREAKT